MDDLLDIEMVYGITDFSKGREKAVWEKILARLSSGNVAHILSEVDNVGNCPLHIIDHCDYPEDFKDNK